MLENWKKTTLFNQFLASSGKKREQKDDDVMGVENWINNEWPKISCDCAPCNLYSAGETGIYYHALPQHSYLFKNEDVTGCKTSIECYTALWY